MLYECTNLKETIDNMTSHLVKDFKEKTNMNINLAVVLASNDGPSRIYVNNKNAIAKKVGINTIEYEFSDGFTNGEIISKIKSLKDDDSINGILLQSPVFDYLDEDKIISYIPKFKDVDGLTDANISALHKAKTDMNECIVPCTALGVSLLVDQYFTCEGEDCNIDKNIVIVGRGKLTGNPLEKVLRNCGYNVTVLHSKTSLENKLKYFNNADLIITATGSDNAVITKDMIKGKKVIIDAGIRFKDGKVLGDCSRDLYNDQDITVTRTPKGTAQLTLSCLMLNTAICAYKQHNLDIEVNRVLDDILVNVALME